MLLDFSLTLAVADWLSIWFSFPGETIYPATQLEMTRSSGRRSGTWSAGHPSPRAYTRGTPSPTSSTRNFRYKPWPRNTNTMPTHRAQDGGSSRPRKEKRPCRRRTGTLPKHGSTSRMLAMAFRAAEHMLGSVMSALPVGCWPLAPAHMYQMPPHARLG